MRDSVMGEKQGNLYPNVAALEPEKEEGTKETDSKTIKKLTRKQIYLLTSLIYNQFWGATCYSIQGPFFPKKAELKGASSTEYGMVFSVFELTIILMSPIFGRMIPGVSPKFLIVAGSFLEGGATFLFGMLDQIHGRTPFIVLAFLIRIVEGLGAAAFITACFAIISTEFCNSLGRAFSLTETAFGLGLIVGPTIGGVLYQEGGFILPFVFCGGMLLIGAPVFMFLLPRIEDVNAPRSRNFRKFVMDPGVLTHIFAIVTACFSLGYNIATLEPHVRQFNLKPTFLSLVFIIIGVVYALTTPVWGWLADKGMGSYTMMGLGYIFTVIGYIFAGPVPFLPFKTKLWLIIVSLVIASTGVAAKLIAAFSGTVKIAPTLGFPDDLATQGMIAGLLPLSASLGAFIGPFLGGFLLDTTGYETGSYVLIAEETFFFSLLLALVLWRKRKHQDAEKTPMLRTDTDDSSVLINHFQVSYSSS